MKTTALLLTAFGLAATTTAQREGKVAAVARAKTTADASCTSSGLSLFSLLPTMPPDLESFYETATGDPCKLSVPSSLSSEQSSWNSAARGVITSHSGDISSFLSHCPTYSTDVAAVTSAVCMNAAAPKDTGHRSVIAAAVVLGAAVILV